MTPKAIVISIAIVLLSFELITTGVNGATVVNIGSLVLTFLLCFSLLMGWAAARWTAVVILGLSVLMALVGGVMLGPKSTPGALLLADGWVSAVCLFALLSKYTGLYFSKSEPTDDDLEDRNPFSKHFWYLGAVGLVLPLNAQEMRGNAILWTHNHPFVMLFAGGAAVCLISYRVNKYFREW